MDQTTTPLTKWASRKRNDMRAQGKYRGRFNAERLLEQRRLEKQIKEVWA